MHTVQRQKTDKRDAKWIANLFRFDIVKASFIPPQISGLSGSSPATGSSFLNMRTIRRSKKELCLFLPIPDKFLKRTFSTKGEVRPKFRLWIHTSLTKEFPRYYTYRNHHYCHTYGFSIYLSTIQYYSAIKQQSNHSYK